MLRNYSKFLIFHLHIFKKKTKVNAEYKYQLVHLTNHVCNGEGRHTHLTKQRRFTFEINKTKTMLIDS
jgi:hypothetical protein